MWSRLLPYPQNWLCFVLRIQLFYCVLLLLLCIFLYSNEEGSDFLLMLINLLNNPWNIWKRNNTLVTERLLPCNRRPKWNPHDSYTSVCLRKAPTILSNKRNIGGAGSVLSAYKKAMRSCLGKLEREIYTLQYILSICCMSSKTRRILICVQGTKNRPRT